MLSGLEGEFQGLGSWYILKESRYLLVKGKMTTGRVSASFPLLQTLTPLCLADQTAQREQENHKIHFFLSMLVSMTDRWV